MKIIIFSFMLFLIINEEKLGIVNACGCAETPFEMYCDSEWVAHVLPIKNEEIKINNWTQLRYEVNILNSYKPSNEANCEHKNKNDYIITPSRDNDCSLNLEINESEYLLGGRYDNDGNKLINDCNIHIEWNELKEETKESLNNGTLENNCKNDDN
uniref:NTR domain-containing protein n=1 Tax=Meloidogyne enterolobii TaxID=390850 RepID=A0A6V7TKJ2_MELEN|nr:unnamed protein product [Meloidogyne enterolobii]